MKHKNAKLFYKDYSPEIKHPQHSNLEEVIFFCGAGAVISEIYLLLEKHEDSADFFKAMDKFGRQIGEYSFQLRYEWESKYKTLGKLE